jgi:GT2 family glycosyltransferase
MTATAVIPHWNRRELLDTLLGSIGNQTLPFHEVIVVDNGSTDDSVKFAEEHGARVIRLGRNFGFAAAVNRGIEAARSEWIAILNNDVTLDAAWLETLLETADREGADFATGKILRAGETSFSDQTAFPHRTRVIDGAFDEVSRGACACRCGAGKPDSTTWNQPRRIRIAPMTAALFRRSLFSEIGPLDERFVSYMEDTDFGLRCALAGRDGVYVPSAVALHRGSATLGAWSYDTVRAISRNQVLLCAKHFQGQPRWPMVAGQLLWGLLAIRHACGVAYLAGKISGWRAARMLHWRIAEAPGTDRKGDCGHYQERLGAIVEASEKEIFEIQQQTGFDTYWRAYFWLLLR